MFLYLLTTLRNINMSVMSILYGIIYFNQCYIKQQASLFRNEGKLKNLEDYFLALVSKPKALVEHLIYFSLMNN